MALTAEQVAQTLYQAGWRGDDLTKMLAIGGRESKYNPAAHRTDNPNPNAQTGDFGLFQINSGNLGFLKSAIGITSMNDLLDPLTNAKAALALKNRSGFAPWAAAAGGFNPTGDPMYGTNYGAAQAAVTNAHLGDATMPTFTGSGAPGAASPTGGGRAPSDARLITTGAETWLLFDLGGTFVSYNMQGSSIDVSALTAEHVTGNQLAQWKAVDGGNADELGSVTATFGSYKAFFDSILSQVMGQNNPAKDDPEVRRILAEFAGRPDMAPAELTNKLEATTWWRTRSTSEIEWNGLADGEKQKRRDEMAARMVSTWQQFTGEAVDMGDPRITNFLEDVASGKKGFGAWTESVVKKAAKDIADSPYNRDIADEAKAKKQPGIDIENTALRIRQMNAKWGVTWSEGTIQDWARKIVNKDASDDDLLEEVKNQAMVLYPWKSRDMDTESAAAPWTETYKRVMEKNGDLTTPDIQKALTAGQPAWEFEQGLKKSSGWLETKNARETMTSMVGSVGKMMGFS